MKIKIFFSSLLVIIMLVVGTSCSLEDIIGTPEPVQAPTVTVTPTATNPINPTWNAPQPTSIALPSGAPDFASIIARVRPSVVAITTKVPSLTIFGPATQEGAGTGWIIDASGLIVTNNHVVEGASSVTVTLEDGRSFQAETVRTDPATDLAIVRINAQSLQATKVGDSSKMRVGDWVIAIGNSLGEGISATQGIVSAMGVSITTDPTTGQTLYDLIQTDAAINPGNSGGPLVNASGEVVGINSVKVAQVGVEGMGYAISIKSALPIVDDLIKLGYVVRPWMGVGLATVTPSVVSRFRLGVDKGAMITQIVAGGPAAQAGLRVQDVITTIDGKAVTSVDELVKAIRTYKIGQQSSITYYRGTAQNNTTMTLAQAPPPT